MTVSEDSDQYRKRKKKKKKKKNCFLVAAVLFLSVNKNYYNLMACTSRLERGVLNFHFGIGVWPEGPQMGA